MDGSQGWEKLVQKSRQQLSSMPGAQTSFPPVQRTLAQLEEFSRRLNARRPEEEARGEAIAASRLLAREGINADQLIADLNSFELQTKFEDVFPLESISLEDYLQQVEEMSMLSVMQEVQKGTQNSFESYMQHKLQDEWQDEKRKFAQALSVPTGVAPQKAYSRPLLLEPKTDKLIPLLHGGHGALQAVSGDVRDMATMASSEKQAVAYALAVKKINENWERGEPLNAAKTLFEAFQKESRPRPEGNRTTWSQVWSLVKAILDEKEGSSLGIDDMILGARKYLEVKHAKFMDDFVQMHSEKAKLGGSQNSWDKIRGYLRASHHDDQVLDFDDKGQGRYPAKDTIYSQIFLALRSGFHTVAMEVARTQVKDSSTLAPMLNEWIQTKGQVSPQTAGLATRECDNMLKHVPPSGKLNYDKRRLWVFAILAGGKKLADEILRNPVFNFSSIEDFLWFRLSIIRFNSASTSSSPLPPPSTLEDLQGYLKNFSSSYYTKQGQDPLLYELVLLVSLQLETAVTHLLSHVPPGVQKSHTLHLCLALMVSGSILVTSKSKKSVHETALQVAGVCEDWANNLLQTSDPVTALEYNVISAISASSGLRDEQYRDSLKAVLQKMMQSYPGRALLLVKDTEKPSPLDRFVKDAGERRSVMLGAAEESFSRGQYKAELELRNAGGDIPGAMKVALRLWSNAIKSMASGRTSEIDSEALTYRDVTKELFSSSQETIETKSLEKTIPMLDAIHMSLHDLIGRDYDKAYGRLQCLAFLPLGTRTAEQALHELQTLPRIVLDLIPVLLVALNSCMDNLTDVSNADRRKLAKFVASSGSQHWPGDVYEQIAGFTRFQ